MIKCITITESEFDDTYPLLPNHLNRDASWATGDGPGCLFETYGEELAFVQSQDANNVWTLVDGDDGDQYLVSGYHYVSRIGYLISTVPIERDVSIECRIPMDTESEGENQ